MRVALPFLAALALAHLPLVGAQELAPVTVAILDTGVDGTHPELAGRVQHVSFTQPDIMGLPVPDFPDLGGVTGTSGTDADGQGTAAASLAAGATLGAAPEASVLDLQVRRQRSDGALEEDDEQAAIRAMDHLLRQEDVPRVVLLSFAASDLSNQGAATLAAQARALWSEGVVVVAPLSPTPNVLTMAPHVLTVTCVDACGGPGQEGPGRVLKPDLAADGSAREAAAPAPAGSTAPVTGTAFAAATVAGEAARVLQERPELSVDVVLALLRNAARDLGPEGPDATTGYGMTDLNATLDAARAWQDPLTPTGSKGSPGVGAGLAMVMLAGAVALARRRTL